MKKKTKTKNTFKMSSLPAYNINKAALTRKIPINNVRDSKHRAMSPQDMKSLHSLFVQIPFKKFPG